MRTTHKSIFYGARNDAHSVAEYQVKEVSLPNAIVTGVERISNDGYRSEFNLVRNIPVNVQA